MENNKNESYYFPEHHVIVAYDFEGEPTGIFMTYPDETFSRQELLGYFQDVHPSYLIAAEVPEVDGLTKNNYHSKLSDFIMDIYENSLDDLDIKYYIPSTLH